MEVEQKEMELHMSCEICIQLMQLETQKELIVFGRDPRLDDAAPGIAHLRPFEGSLEYSSGEALKADANGFLRSSAALSVAAAGQSGGQVGFKWA